MDGCFVIQKMRPPLYMYTAPIVDLRLYSTPAKIKSAKPYSRDVVGGLQPFGLYLSPVWAVCGKYHITDLIVLQCRAVGI